MIYAYKNNNIEKEYQDIYEFANEHNIPWFVASEALNNGRVIKGVRLSVKKAKECEPYFSKHNYKKYIKEKMEDAQARLAKETDPSQANAIRRKILEFETKLHNIRTQGSGLTNGEADSEYEIIRTTAQPSLNSDNLIF